MGGGGIARRARHVADYNGGIAGNVFREMTGKEAGIDVVAAARR